MLYRVLGRGSEKGQRFPEVIFKLSHQLLHRLQQFCAKPAAMAFTMQFLGRFSVHCTKFDPKQHWFIFLLKSHYQLMAVSTAESSSGLARADLPHTSPCSLTNSTASGRRKQEKKARKKSVGISSNTGHVWFLFAVLEVLPHSLTLKSGQSSLCLWVRRPGDQHFSSIRQQQRGRIKPCFQELFRLMFSDKVFFLPQPHTTSGTHDICQSYDHSLLEGNEFKEITFTLLHGGLMKLWEMRPQHLASVHSPNF